MNDRLYSHLYQQGLQSPTNGYPLWVPEPPEDLPKKYRDRGVTPGDVLILTDDGGYDFLFNILDEPTSPTQVPEGFQHLVLNREDVRFVDSKDKPGAVLSETGVVEQVKITQQDEPRASSSGSSAASFELVTSTSNGALLVLPDGADHLEIINYSALHRYMECNIASWFQFANTQCGGRGLNTDHLCLVTSCRKSASWGIASFSSSSPQYTKSPPRNRQLSMKLSIDKDGPYVWDVPSGVQTRSKRAPLKNQCVFLKGFIISRRPQNARTSPTSTSPNFLSENRRRDSARSLRSLSDRPSHLLAPTLSHRSPSEDSIPSTASGLMVTAPFASSCRTTSQLSSEGASPNEDVEMKSESENDTLSDLSLSPAETPPIWAGRSVPNRVQALNEVILEKVTNGTLQYVIAHDGDAETLQHQAEKDGEKIISLLEKIVQNVERYSGPAGALLLNLTQQLAHQQNSYMNSSRTDLPKIDTGVASIRGQEASQISAYYEEDTPHSSLATASARRPRPVRAKAATMDDVTSPYPGRKGREGLNRESMHQALQEAKLKPKGIRAKSGCYTCRIRRKKCDERPNENGECETCVRLRLQCLGFGAKRPDWLRDGTKVAELRERIKTFLASNGMIRGAPPWPATIVDPVPPESEEQHPVLALEEENMSPSPEGLRRTMSLPPIIAPDDLDSDAAMEDQTPIHTSRPRRRKTGYDEYDYEEDGRRINGGMPGSPPPTAGGSSGGANGPSSARYARGVYVPPPPPNNTGSTSILPPQARHLS